MIEMTCLAGMLCLVAILPCTAGPALAWEARFSGHLCELTHEKKAAHVRLAYDPAITGIHRGQGGSGGTADWLRQGCRKPGVNHRAGAVHALEHWLAAREIRSKRWVTAGGRVLGGRRFSRGALFHLLRNRVYLGMIVHKGKVHPGMHPAIVETDLFEAVQARLDANARRFFARSESATATPAPLARRIFDADGQPMSPTASRGARGKIYRYYVSAPLQQGTRRRKDDGIIRRVPAAALEARVAEIVRRTAGPNGPDPLSLVTRIEVHTNSLHLLMAVAHLPKVRDRLMDGEHAEMDANDPSSFA